MIVYIVLLRGINVGGKNQIKMAELRTHLENDGFIDVKTYIQSGNIVLKSDMESSYAISNKVESIIKSKLNLEVPAIAISPLQLENSILNNPYLKDEEDQSRLIISFLKSIPESDRIQSFNSLNFPPDRAVANEGVVYMHVPEGSAKTKFTIVLIEKELGVIASARNIRSCGKLLEMAAEIK